MGIQTICPLAKATCIDHVRPPFFLHTDFALHRLSPSPSSPLTASYHTVITVGLHGSHLPCQNTPFTATSPSLQAVDCRPAPDSSRPNSPNATRPRRSCMVTFPRSPRQFQRVFSSCHQQLQDSFSVLSPMLLMHVPRPTSPASFSWYKWSYTPRHLRLTSRGGFCFKRGVFFETGSGMVWGVS